jgi:hypothetical protein
MSKFTAEQKCVAIKRELKLRRRVYPRWIEAGRIDSREAVHEIAIMEAIAEDYEKLAQQERLL